MSAVVVKAEKDSKARRAAREIWVITFVGFGEAQATDFNHTT